MKKRITIIMMALAAVACTIEQPEVTIIPRTEQELTITASYADFETRTERALDGTVLWSPNDEISVFYGSGSEGGSKFISQNTESAKTANFTGSIDVITGGNDYVVNDTFFWAIYPYSPYASCDGNSITTVLPAEQTAKPDSFSDDLYPSIGRSQGLNIAFYNICGGIKFTVSEEGIKSVTLNGHNNEILAGTITVTVDNGGIPSVTNITNGSKTITVSSPDGGFFEVGKAYYIVIIPTIFKEGFTLRFNKEFAQASLRRMTKTTIRRSAFGTLITPDKDLEWEEPLVSYVPIPDHSFRTYMLENFDYNGNDELDIDEAEMVTNINVITDNIESLAGIEYCTNLQSLICTGTNPTLNNGLGKLTSLDLRNNSGLTYLDCRQNEITTLEISHNYLLQRLYCDDNQLTSLDVSSNTALTSLYCFNNQLTSLDVSSNTSLTTLSCYSNQLTSLDVSHNTALTSLYCSSNQLTSLNVNSDTSLKYLDCWSNKLSSLDISSNINLIELRCDSNQLNSLDVSANTALMKLYCENNQLTSLSVSSNTALMKLYCENNQLTSLDVSSNTALTSLYCFNNQLTSLDVSSNTALTSLSCSNNQLTSLDVSANTELTELFCYSNQLSSLDLSANTALIQLTCNQNSLNSINVSNNGSLEKMNCSTNLLTSLDVSENLCLKELKCNNNPNLSEIWITTEQPLTVFVYDTGIAIIKYKGDPIIRPISTPDEFLSWVATCEETPPSYGQEWTIEADLDCGGATISAIPVFSSILNGKGHKIFNLRVVSDTFETGLILSNYGTVKDIAFGSSDGINYDGISSISPSNGSGGGHMGLVANNYGRLENVVNYMTIDYHANNNNGYSVGIGGLVGNCSVVSRILNCTNYASINVSGTPEQTTSIGGIIGIAQADGISIEGCINISEIIVTFPVRKVLKVGGIIGESRGEVVIENCRNNNNVSYNQIQDPNTWMSLGGISGISYSGAKVLNCINNGTVSSNLHQAQRVAGIIGTLNSGGRVEGCVNNGDVNIQQANPNSNWQTAGGIVGLQEKDSNDANGDLRRNIIINNTNNGQVSITVENTTVHSNRVSAAGIIGIGCLDIDIINNTNKGSISIDNKADGDAYCGGIMAMAVNTDVKMEGNTNEGSVYCKTSDDIKSCAGGVVADAGHYPGRGDVTTVTATGDKNTGIITCANASMTGSIVGINLGSLINCLAGGSVNGALLTTSNYNQLVQGAASTGTAEGTILAP